MTDLTLDQNTGDVLITNGAASVVEGADATGQRIYVKLRTFRGEHFLDNRAGLPYHDRILVRGANEPDLIQIYTQGILSVPGVESVDRLELEVGDSDDRTLRVDADVTTNEGEISLTAGVPSVS
jgi:hypothetical protein